MPKPFKILTAEEVIQMLKGRKYKYAQVHHTYIPNHSHFNGKNHIRLQENMWNYHVNTNKWSDIGQHLTLMPDGLFVTGRDFNVTPAGITGKNTGSFMIELLGNFDKGNDKLEGKQLEATLKVYKYLTEHCEAQIIFHRDYAPKSCPGTGIDYNRFVNMVKNYGQPQQPQYSETTVYYNNNAIKGLISGEGVTFVQLRQLADLLGNIQIGYEQSTNTVTFNNKVVKPLIIEGRSYMPVRSVCEDLGMTVNWDGKNVHLIK